MRAPKTNFELIPVEMVKKVAKEFGGSHATAGSDGNHQGSNGARPSAEPWRALAEQVQRELDPDKMIDLVQELIAKIDEEKSSKSLPVARKAHR
jgi:hypothetical protein